MALGNIVRLNVNSCLYDIKVQVVDMLILILRYFIIRRNSKLKDVYILLIGTELELKTESIAASHTTMLKSEHLVLLNILAKKRLDSV